MDGPDAVPTLTVVGQTRLAETHDEVDFHFMGRHRLGADRTLESWETDRWDQNPQRPNSHFSVKHEEG